jgi:1-acyl-sn-glycerol-3-phosphate acyltransferase
VRAVVHVLHGVAWVLWGFPRMDAAGRQARIAWWARKMFAVLGMGLEVRVGRLVGAAGTLYIVREKARDALRVVHQMADALSSGDTVAVFPEGTTGHGHELLPFHANLLQAAIATQVPVQPVALRYADELHAVSPAADYTGTISLARSLWLLAGAQGLKVRVEILSAEGVRHADRRALAAHLREEIADALERMDERPAATVFTP